MAEPPKFSFGSTPNSSAGASSNLFGNATGGSQLFGSTSAAPSGGGLFGNTGASGNTGATPTFGFGGLGKKPEENKDASKTPSFSFGTPAKTSAPSGPSLFGGAGSSNTSSAPFGSTTPAPTSTSTGFSFGSTTPAGPPPSTSTGSGSGPTLFGNLGGQKPATGPSLFGQKPSEAPTTSSAAPSGPLFGNTGSSGTSGSNLFGQPTGSSGAPTPSFFGGPAKSNEAPKPAEVPKPAASPNLFGDLGSASSAAPNPSATTTAPSTSQPTSTLFGAKPSDTPKATPSFNFGKSATTSNDDKPTEAPKPAFSGFTPSTSATPSTSSTAPSSNLFGNNNKPSAAPSSSAPAPSSTLFSGLGQPAATSAPSASAATTSANPGSNLFGQSSSAAPTSTTPAASAPSLFTSKSSASTSIDNASKPAPSSAPSASTTLNASGPPPAANLNASTTGPLPPSQSRLKNKTMDEIITRWATDLTKYQKEFQAQAEQVAAWDQLLVDNMAKISKLYVATATAEKQTSSVEMQLTAVENQQEELSSWLDRYEREVDDMMGKGIGGDGGLQGVDQERERTYKLAEKLSDRLEDMGKDLTTMIEDINTASASLSKQTKSDEPISQIVKILNSHLSQLQAIDQGTQGLQAKIALAQKSGREMGGYGNGYAGYGSRGDQGGAVDDFYRSYMGRR